MSSSLSNGQTDRPEQTAKAESSVARPQDVGHLARALLLACGATALLAYLLFGGYTGVTVALVFAWTVVSWVYVVILVIRAQTKQQSREP